MATRYVSQKIKICGHLRFSTKIPRQILAWFSLMPNFANGFFQRMKKNASYLVGKSPSLPEKVSYLVGKSPSLPEKVSYLVGKSPSLPEKVSYLVGKFPSLPEKVSYLVGKQFDNNFNLYENEKDKKHR